MAKRDYYEVLGVASDASSEELKRAYRKLTMRFHPDRHQGKSEAEQKKLAAEFQEVKEAYETLSDPDKRALYNQLGHAGYERAAQGGGPAGAGGAYEFGDVFSDLGNIFSEVFGGRRGSGRSSQRAQRGTDLRYTLSLTLEDVIFGYSTSIKVPRLGRCQQCEGTGSRNGDKPTVCRTCGGAGQVYLQHGPFSIQQTCPDCQGEGQRINDPCSVCRGSGQVREMRTLSVKIPVGIDEGDQIRLAGEGEAGIRGGPAGDLYVQVQIKPHAFFKRQSYDLYAEMPVSYAMAVLGGEMEVPTLEGKVKLHIPSGTANGKVLKLKGKGIPKMRGHGAGDLFLTLMVEVPLHLNKEQRERLTSFEASLTDRDVHYPRLKKWIKEIKDFFTRKSTG